MALGLAALAFLLAPHPVRGFGFPMGPDAPVYLWWTRLAGVEGLSAVGLRPGVPGVALLLSGTLGLAPSQVLAGLGAAMGAAAGLGAVALVAGGIGPGGPGGRPGSGEARRWRPRWGAAWTAGVLTVAFTVHVAAGYLANLAAVVLVLGGAAALAVASGPIGGRGRRGGVLAAGAMLGAAGLAHPLFLALGGAVLAGAALLAVVADRPDPAGARRGLLDREPGRMAAALGGGVLLAGAGFLVLLPGPRPPDVDTSKDAFLRRVGQDLRGEYLKRLGRQWYRYLLPVTAPVAAWGVSLAGGFLGRLLLSWTAVTVVGVGFALATGLVPAVRLLSFAYAIPLAGAVVAARLAAGGLRGRRSLGMAAAGLLVAALLVAGTWTWWIQRTFVSAEEARAASGAARIAAGTPDGTPLVFLVHEGDQELLFLSARAGNVIRAAMPAGRIRDVHVYVGTPERFLAGEPTLTGNDRHDALSRDSLARIRAAGGDPVAFVLAPFNTSTFDGARATGDEVAPGVVVVGGLPPPPAPVDDPLGPFAPWSAAVAGVAVLVSLSATGYGWARAALGSGPFALLLSPAVGLGGLTLGAVLADGAGLGLAGAAAPAAAVTVALAGHAAAFWTGRRRGDDRGRAP
ncbi:MAG: hypothetical protein HY658_05935 [Actinobacteria bacterium]|nr:hypothetical protein [Actinomycetota bacterium]